MAKGLDRHQAHKQAVAALGKNLSRRASSRCELCEATQGLAVIEVFARDEPDEETAILACERCRTALSKGPDPQDNLRALEGSAWSEVTPVQVAAVRLLQALSNAEIAWAQQTLDGLWIPDEITALVDEGA